MPEAIVERLDRLAADVLPEKSHTVDMGENYYSFKVTDELGTRCELPHIWIDPATSDEQIREKLSRLYQEAVYPEAGPDDASVPNIQTEGNRHA
jgi:hypothetical protein